MPTGAFVLVAALVTAAQIAFALTYGNGTVIADERSEQIEYEFERELQALVAEALATGPEDRMAPLSDGNVSARSAAPADRQP